MYGRITTVFSSKMMVSDDNGTNGLKDDDVRRFYGETNLLLQLR
jgi:hypothetical protein